MTSDLRARLSQSRLTGFLVAATVVLLIGLLLGLPALADPEQPVPPPGRGYGSGSGSLSLPADQRLTGEPILVPLASAGWTTVLSENFEGTWPSAGWYVFDNDSPPSTYGEYYWANRCSGHNSTSSAWCIGGGANGSSLSCGASYPNLANSWMVYGPLNLSQATAADMSFYFWLRSECDDGTNNCANAADPLWAVASTDGINFYGQWWAGDLYLDGWVTRTLNLNSYAGQPQVWIGFLFESDGSVNYPGGAYVDDVVVRAYTTGATPTPTTCAATAYVTFTTDSTCYRPGTQIGVLVSVGTSLPSQSVRVEATLWSGDVIWGPPAEQAFTAPGQRVLQLQVPADLFPGDYTVLVRVFDAATNCFQASAQRTIRVDPVCGTITPTATATRTPTRTPTPTATVTCTPVLEATLCPGQSITETKYIFISPAPGRADVLFAFDTTGSMGPVLSSAKTNAVNIMNNLAALIPDIQFGVVDLRDYPISPYGDSGDWAYLLRQAITSNRTAVQTAINATSAGGGNDSPEAYSRALYESYADPAIGWRTDARRFVIMFGDDVPHDNNLNERVVNPPVNPGGTWCGNTSAGCVLDPGRDGTPGTADDLNFQTVLDAMNTNRITLLYVVSGGGSTSQANLVTYWKQWAGWTNTGGDAVPLDNAANLPTVIQNLVARVLAHT